MYILFIQVTSESPKTKEAQMEDKSLSDHDDPKMTSDDILSVKHLNSTFEGIQNLGGGTDIKV